MHYFKKESAWDKVTKPLTRLGGRTARNGLTAGAALVAVTVASAVTSAVRKREEKA